MEFPWIVIQDYTLEYRILVEAGDRMPFADIPRQVAAFTDLSDAEDYARNKSRYSAFTRCTVESRDAGRATDGTPGHRLTCRPIRGIEPMKYTSEIGPDGGTLPELQGRSRQFDHAWKAVVGCEELWLARRKLSIHELRTLINLVIDSACNEN
jgi:hypothetical protein